MAHHAASADARVGTGIPELDDILHGGLVAGGAYLIRGGPGRGKTTLGMHFLATAPDDEPALFIGFQEAEPQLRANAAAIGLDLSRAHVLSLMPDEHFFAGAEGYDIFSAADVEAEPLADAVVEAVERTAPRRVFVDSITQLRFLSADVF